MKQGLRQRFEVKMRQRVEAEMKMWKDFRQREEGRYMKIKQLPVFLFFYFLFLIFFSN
jgi:hypothetical protein